MNATGPITVVARSDLRTWLGTYPATWRKKTVTPKPRNPNAPKPEPLVNPPRKVRAVNPPGKADPVWDTQFKPKWNKTPITDELPVPKGYTEPHGLKMYLDRIAEINDLARTQHLDLPPLDLQLNGTLDFNDEQNAAEYAERHLNRVPYEPDPATIRNTQTRIEWERYQFACSKVTKVQLTKTPDGRLGLEEPGAPRQNKETLRWAAMRFRDAGLLDKDPEELIEDRLRVRYHRGVPVLAACDPVQLDDYRYRTGDYDAYTCAYGDDDPTRDTVHTQEQNEKWAKPGNDGQMQDIGFDDPDFPSPAVMYENEDGTVEYG